MKRLAILDLALIGLVTLTSGSAFAANDVMKPCDLLNQQQAEKLYGGPLDPASSIVGTCMYFGPHQDSDKGILITFFPAGSLGPAANVASMYKTLVHSDPTNTVTPMSGLGDQANLLSSDGGRVLILMVLYHNNIIGVGSTASPNPRIKDDLVQTIRQWMQKL